MANDWINVQLQDVVSKLGDGLHGTPKYSENGEYYFINGNNLENGQIIFKEKTKRVDHTQYLKYKKELNERTLLVSINGTIGNVAYYNGEKVILGKSACYFNLKDDIDKGYVRYVLSGHYFQSYLNAFATGTTIQNVSLKSMREFSFPLPPIEEQKAIAHILGSLDYKIELNRQMNDTLEAMAQALFKSWFVDFDPVIDNALAVGNTIPDVFIERAEQRKGIEKKNNSDIQSLFPNEFEFTEEMGWIPKGWRTSTLDDLTTELRRGISPKYTEVDGVRVVNQRCIRNHSIDYSICRLNDANVRKVEGRYLEVGDVLVNSTGVGTLGRMAQVFYLDEPAVVDSHVTVVRPNTGLIKPHTFGRLMLSIEPLVESMGLGSTGQTELSRVHLGELVVCIPPIDLQKFVEKSFLSYSDKSAFNIQQNITLSKLRDTLLPKLMSGELRITDAAALVDEVV